MSWPTNPNSNNLNSTNIQGFLDISGTNVTLRNNTALSVGGASTFYGQSTFGQLSTPVPITINGNLNTSLDSSFNGNLYVGKVLDVSGKLIALGDISCNGVIYGRVNNTTFDTAGNVRAQGGLLLGWTGNQAQNPQYGLDMTNNRYQFSSYGTGPSWSSDQRNTNEPLLDVAGATVTEKLIPDPKINFSGSILSTPVTSFSGGNSFRNVTYDISASSISNNNYIGNAFNNQSSNYWESGQSYTQGTSNGSYTGTTITSFQTANPQLGSNPQVPPPVPVPGCPPCDCDQNTLGTNSGSTGTTGITSTGSITVDSQTYYTYNISGEYIQIDLSYECVLTSYTLISSTGNVPTGPSWLVFGSTDGNTWYPIDSKISTPSNSCNILSGTGSPHNILTPAIKFKYYRIVFTSYPAASGTIQLVNWQLTGTYTYKQSELAYYSGCAMSSTGQYQAISVNGGNVFLSNNFGIKNSWTLINGPVAQLWSGVAISSTGQYQTAVSSGTGNVFCSNNYGLTWSWNMGGASYTGIAMSSTGQYQTATPKNQYILMSQNYGQTWNYDMSSTIQNWSGVAMSATGQYQVATVNGGSIFLTTNGTATTPLWTDISNLSSSNNLAQIVGPQPWYWASIAMSANGQYIAADICGGNIYISADRGNTWSNSSLASAPTTQNLAWSGLAMSSTGQYITAQTASGGDIWVSETYGTTWKNQTKYSTDPSGALWHNSAGVSTALGQTLTGGSLAISATGQIQTVVTTQGNIYTSYSNVYPSSYNMVVKGLPNGGGGITQSFDQVAGETQSYLNIISSPASVNPGQGGALGGGIDAYGNSFLTLNTDISGSYSEMIRITNTQTDSSATIYPNQMPLIPFINVMDRTPDYVTTASGTFIPTIELANMTNQNFFQLHTNLSNDAYNVIVQAKDMGIIYGSLGPALLENGIGGVGDNNGFVLAPAAGTSGLRMDASGNVAIGQSSVTSGYIFDVSGNAQIDGSLNVLRGGTFGGQVNAASLNLGSGSITSGAISGTSLSLNGGTPGPNSISTNSLTATSDIYVNGITVGRGTSNNIANTAIGSSALLSNTTGDYNTAIGYGAMFSNTTGQYNTAIGVNALSTDVSGTNNVAIGYDALQNNLSTGTVGIGSWALQFYKNDSSNNGHNTAIGIGAGVGGYSIDGVAAQPDISGYYNTYLGGSTGIDNSSNSYNWSTAIGFAAAITGNHQIVLGTVNETVICPNNVLVNGITVGRGSGNVSSNTTFGSNALITNNGIGYDNSAFGSNALNFNTSGNNNSAFGAMALNNNTTGVWNSAFGIEALKYNTTSSYNTAFGANALGQGIPGPNNSAFGAGALALTTGYYNTAIGANSLANYTVNASNYSVQTAIGYNSGAGSNGLNTGSAYPDTGGYSNIYIGPFTGVNTQNAIYYNSVAIGYATAITASNQIMLGFAGISVVTPGTMTALSFNANSDYRIKENVETLDPTFTVDNLRPVQYDTKDAKNHAIGFIAHEVQKHYPFLVDGEKDGEKTQSINYNGFIGILVNEIQQLKKTVAKQAETIDKQTETVAKQSETIDKQTVLINQILARFA